MSNYVLSRSFRKATLCLVLCAGAPLACAVAIEPEQRAEEGGTAGSLVVGGASAGTSPVLPVAGTTSTAFGGTTSTSGGSSTAGSSSSAGKGGVSSSGGKTGSGGHAGMSMAGMSSGGVAGSVAGGSGGGGSNGCGALKSWKGGDSTLTIAAGEVVQWMGKRYKATASIAYPNTECAPDAPAMWCANWFTPDGSC